MSTRRSSKRRRVENIQSTNIKNIKIKRSNQAASTSNRQTLLQPVSRTVISLMDPAGDSAAGGAPNAGWKSSLAGLSLVEVFNNPVNFSPSLIDVDVRKPEDVTKDIQQSPNDKLKYRVIELENGLVALLISDLKDGEDPDETAASESEEEEEEEEESDEDDGDSEEDQEEDMNEDQKKPGQKLSAASLCIGVGSMSDPPEIPGLAHFLEHMVFMGSEKYPDENSFDSFNRKHGGNSNAYTELDRTVFYFDIERKHFHEGLDRFAQFFISPLMKQDSVDREVQAVDSEFEMSLTSDTARTEQLLQAHMDQSHPLSKFAWGNKKTLHTVPNSSNIDAYSHLTAFYQRMYSAHYITLAVQSKDTLDNLESWVTAIFKDIPNNGLPKPRFMSLPDPIGSARFLKLYKVVPVKDVHKVDIVWSLPSLLHHYSCKPLHYLGWLIGHEGKGSILSYLKKKLWATGLSGGNSETNFEHNSTWAQFAVSVTLTEDGLSNVQQVIEVVFQYLEMLRKLGPQERIYREIQTIEDNEFRWQEQSEPVDNVDTLCVNMQMYPVNHYLSGDKLMFHYNPKLISECEKLLIPERCTIMISSKQFDKDDICDKKEQWFHTKYSQSDIPQEWITGWKDLKLNPELHIPEENQYIASDFNIKDADVENTEFPVKVENCKQNNLWHKKDNKFKIPKAYIYFHLISPHLYETCLRSVHQDLYLRTLEQNLADVAYAADAAQLSYSVRADEKGIVLKVNGFNHKLPKLFHTVVDHMADFSVGDDMLRTMKDQLRRTYKNQCIKANKLVHELRLALIQKPYWSSWSKLEALNDVTVESMQQFVAKFKADLCVEGLVHGNITTSEARDLEAYIVHRLGCSALQPQYMPQKRVYKIEEGQQYLRVQNLNRTDNCCVLINYYQHGPCTIQHSLYNELLVMIMQEPCFDYLRTQKQLGYTVFCTNRNTAGILGLSVTVCSQSVKFSMTELDKHIEDFLVHFHSTLKELSDEDFQSQVDALITLKQCEDSHLGEETERLWTEIQTQNYIFNRLQREVEYLKTVTKEDILTWLESHTPVAGAPYRKLSTQVIGCDEDKPKPEGDSGSLTLQFVSLEGNNHKTITDFEMFHQKSYLYPESKIVS